MKKFGFRYINDKSSESIDKKEFKTHYEAVEFFASRKKLSIANFLKIYKVFEV